MERQRPRTKMERVSSTSKRQGWRDSDGADEVDRQEGEERGAKDQNLSDRPPREVTETGTERQIKSLRSRETERLRQLESETERDSVGGQTDKDAEDQNRKRPRTRETQRRRTTKTAWDTDGRHRTGREWRDSKQRSPAWRGPLPPASPRRSSSSASPAAAALGSIPRAGGPHRALPPPGASLTAVRSLAALLAAAAGAGPTTRQDGRGAWWR